MQGGVASLQIVFLVLLFLAVAFASLAQRLKTPYPIILVVGGLLLSFAPGIPKVDLDPDVVFSVFLPPLLYSAAWNTSWREFRYNLTSILLLAIGLVAFTVFGVAAVAHYWPAAPFTWSTGAVLGAVVATTDAVAATSIARRLGVQRRIVDVVEGESLVNDATGLLALEFTTAMVVSNQKVSIGEGSLRLLYLSGAGIAVGLLIGYVVDFLEHRIDDGPIEIAISILVSYGSYFTAEAVHASGVLAVVTSGLYLSRRSVHFFSPGVRMQATAVWNAIDFLLNGVVFLLIGFQLPGVLSGIRSYDRTSLIALGAVFALVVVALRLLWVFPSAQISWRIRTLLGQHEEPPPARGVFIIGWAGMRGVIALAAALSLPVTLSSGAPFPNRNLILFLTYSVILVTLVGQGLTLAPLIRMLKLQSSEERDPEEFEARRRILQASLRHLEEVRNRDAERFADVYDDVAQHYRTRLDTLVGEGADEHGSSGDHVLRYQNVTRELLQFERATAVDLRNRGEISDDALRRILNEIDLSETRIA